MRRRCSPAARGLLLLLTISCCASSASAAPSSYSSGPGGLKVLYLLLGDLGYQVTRLFDGRSLGPQIAAVVLSGATDRLASAPLLSWVKSGGRLILAPARTIDDETCGEIALGDLTLRRRLILGAQVPAHPDLSFSAGRCLLELPEGATLIAGAPGAALALSFSHGSGQILALAQDELLINAELHRADVAVLLRRWLAQQLPAGAQLAFLEQQQETFISLVRRAHLGPLLVSALLWLALLYWRLIPRFGDASPEPQTTRRAFSQHARALGHLYQRQGAAPTMLRRQYERFLARVGGAREQPLLGGAPGGGRARHLPSDAALQRLLATRTGEDPAEIARLLTRVREAATAPGRVDGREAQTYYRLSRSLAALQRVSAPRSNPMGGNRGRSERR